jgi:lactate permease
MAWEQNYDPLGSAFGSTLFAALPILVLLTGLGLLRMKAHRAALLGLACALLVAVFVFRMPPGLALESAALGGAYGLLPIGWIVLNVLFLYEIAESQGLLAMLKEHLTAVTADRRLQILLIAFCFGAFFEGAAGFGAPVAITAAILIGLGFPPLAASSLSLLANTAPVAFGALGTPIVALQAATNLDLFDLSAMVGRQLPFFSILIPFWLVAAFAGWRGMVGVAPAIFVAGATFAIVQFLVSNLHGPWLVDVVAATASAGALVLFLRLWHPRDLSLGTGAGTVFEASEDRRASHGAACAGNERPEWQVFAPWLILCIAVFLWGLPQIRAALDAVSAFRIPVSGLDNMALRMPPVVAAPRPEAAVFNFNWLSATGTGILVAALLSGAVLKLSPQALLRLYARALYRVRHSLATIAAMVALGFVTRYAGLDATMGLAFARTGAFYPFFGAMLGWVGVALTGSDTASNVLFGGLQTISAGQLGLSPTLMAAANSSGGVMGKMIDAQSIVVASAATGFIGHEGAILRRVFLHSLVLAALVGVLVMLQAYVFPFDLMTVGPPR